MDISNAIRNVERVFMNYPGIASEEDIESFEIAVEALAKQKPIRINAEYEYDGSLELSCGICGCEIYEKMNFCPNCGQRIDWVE